MNLWRRWALRFGERPLCRRLGEFPCRVARSKVQFLHEMYGEAESCSSMTLWCAHELRRLHAATVFQLRAPNSPARAPALQGLQGFGCRVISNIFGATAPAYVVIGSRIRRWIEIDEID
jgi:hypothetical protein